MKNKIEKRYYTTYEKGGKVILYLKNERTLKKI